MYHHNLNCFTHSMVDKNLSIFSGLSTELKLREYSLIDELFLMIILGVCPTNDHDLAS